MVGLSRSDALQSAAQYRLLLAAMGGSLVIHLALYGALPAVPRLPSTERRS